MDKIQRRLREINECADKYGINKELGDSSSSGAVLIRRPVRQVILPDEDDLEIVGLQKDTANVVKLLLDPNTKRRCVVSIVGQGGLGKTTLARKVYNSAEVKNGFNYQMWLLISQQYNLLGLLKTMLEKIRPLTEDEKALPRNNDQHSLQTAEQHFIAELKMTLKDKRYLIVMDDVWVEDIWIQIKAALPDVGNGSRVLVTTRLSDIAKKAEPTSDPYSLRYLSEEESQKLLLKKAFPNQDSRAYPQDLSDLPMKFAKRCGGLPLALEVVGGLLSRQSPTYHSGHKVFERFSWRGDEGKKCTEILETSYEDLPVILKPCFMYFASYPEDYEIKAKSLIRMWVAEGFIPKEESKTLEEAAEDCLEELIQRNMIQVSQRKVNGSIKYCRIHDLLRDLAIIKAKENMFLEIIWNEGGNCSSSTTTVRRATLHCNRNDIITMENTGRNLRSLLFFGNGTIELPNIEKCKLLKVLNGEYRKGGGGINGDIFTELAQLRYIAIPYLELNSRYGSKILATRQFQNSIRRMRNLQTLHIPFHSEYKYNLFDCIWDIKTLRHVIVTRYAYYGPPCKADLPNLQTLKGVRVRAEWLTKGWPKIPNIRVLTLVDFPPHYGESFHTFLSGLCHLTSLRAENFFGLWEHEMRDTSQLPCYNYLQSLSVEGQWTKTKEQGDFVPVAVATSSFPIHLTKLVLENSRIEKDPMPILEKLGNLRLLNLGNDAYIGKQMCCSAGGFPCLQFLVLECLNYLEEWSWDWKTEADDRPMSMLKNIFICELRVVPGLSHMASLTNFTVHGLCYTDTSQILPYCIRYLADTYPCRIHYGYVSAMSCGVSYSFN